MMPKLAGHEFKVVIGGELACFTRPEMKVERVSYEVITPSAARGVLEAILWKPAIRWVIERIHVIKPIRWTSFKRNEVTNKLAVGTVRKAIVAGKLPDPYLIEDYRAQRHTLALRDVQYVVEARFEMTDRAGPEDNPNKFTEMFRRRLEGGQCYRMPYLGCREFAAWFGPQDRPFKAIDESRDLGWMLHDIEFRPNAGNLPHFFHAEMESGVIDVPALLPGIQASGGAR